ncbi:MAG: ATP-binding protein [Geobacteraceae bacterium]|nr:ATP-binding protein [Geobacteraceae bacterium]
MNLKSKIVSIIIVVILILTAVFGYFMKTAVYASLEEEIDRRALAIGKHFAELSAEAELTGSTSVLKTHLADYIATESYLAYIVIIDGNDQIQADTFRESIPPEILAVIKMSNSSKSMHIFRRSDGVELEDFSVRIGTGLEGIVHIGIYETKVTGAINRLMLRLTPYLLAVILAGILIAFLLASAITRPLQILSDGVKRVTRGDLDFLINVRTYDEIGQLAEAFNLMTGNLRESTVSREFMEKLVNTMNDVVVVISSEGVVMSVNRAYYELLGPVQSEVIGRRIDELDPNETPARMFAAYERSLIDGHMQGIESVCFSVTGEQIPLLLSLAVMRDEAGAPQAIICAAQDISAIKKVQLELHNKQVELETLNQQLEDQVASRTAELAINNEGLRAEVAERMRTAEELAKALDTAQAASRAKTEFLANMSHEMRTPLNSIIGGAEYLEFAGLTPDQQRCLEMIRRSGDSLLLLVNDLIDLSRIEAGQFELLHNEFNLADTLETVARMLSLEANRKQLDFSLQMSPDLPQVVIGDQARLQQILVNLLANAIKFTGNGGTVTVSAQTGHVEDGSVQVTFVVRDTGIGIEANKIDMIFETFAQADSSITRRFGGSGLGLAISRRLVETMGGAFQVESVPGIGSSFAFSIRFALPGCSQLVAPQSTTGAATRETSDYCTIEEQPATGPPHILLVDDSLENRELMRLLLSRQPLILDEAYNGREAVDLFEQNNYALILMDIQMPIMDGYTATRMMRRIEERRLRRRTPIVALTAHAYEADIRRCIEAGCDDHIAKPFKKKVLLQCLARHIRGIEHG